MALSHIKISTLKKKWDENWMNEKIVNWHMHDVNS